MPQPSAIARAWDLKQPINAMAVNRNGDWIAAAMGDGSVRMLPAKESAEKPRAVQAHQGVSLSLQPDADAQGFLSGGDDGTVVLIDPVMASPTVLAEQKGKWIDHVASSPEGFRAYSFGKQVQILNAEGKPHGGVLAHPSTVGGMAFAPNGKRLAVSHYDGLSLWWLNAKEQTPTKLTWKGSHLGVVWHPDSKMVITALQDASLHGWRLSDMAEMQMQGYASKVHSMGFSARGKYLVTSGAGEVICWPFFGGGPWGKNPLTLGGSDGRMVSCVAPHPKDEMVAAGYEDGKIILAPMDGRMEMMVYHPHVTRDYPGLGSPEAGSAALSPTAKPPRVVGMAWNAAGDCLFSALENGYILLFTIDSVRKSLTHA